MDLRHLDVLFEETRGIFTVAMLESQGYSRRTVRSWIERGHVVRVCGRGYVRRGRTVTVWHRAIAARLTWPDAIVCFVTAALLHGLPIDDDGVTHVLVPSVRSPIAGIRPHHWSVHPTEVVRDGLIAVTDRRTTIADCFGRLPNDDAWGMLAWMFTRDQVCADDVEAQLGERNHLYGVVRLRLMAAALRRNAVSVPEMHLQDFLLEHGITGWVGNGTVYQGQNPVARGDVVFEERRVILEYDGKVAHPPGSSSRDARRDRVLHRRGYEILHITWERLQQERGLLRDVIRALLRERDGRRRRALADAWNDRETGALREMLSARAPVPAL